jgi:RimJ/RimL family protein N-acetyltransferase
MADPLRAERVTLRDGRTVVIRPAAVEDAEATLKNINLIGAEHVYIMIERVDNLDEERRWLSSFDGIRNVLLLALSGREVIATVDCHGGIFPKDRHVGGIGIAIRDGWREVGLGRLLMERVLEWMRARGFEKAELAVFAGNDRARGLYESLGFAEEGVRRGHVRIRGEYVDEILMGLWLDGGTRSAAP